MIDYNPDFNPPAIMLSVVLAGVVHRRPRIEVPALIDTGADITAVPEQFEDTLKLYPFGRLQLEGIDAVKTPAYSYEVRLALAGEPVKEMEVVLTPYSFAILGRDWLRDYYVFLDGPGQKFQVNNNPFPM